MPDGVIVVRDLEQALERSRATTRSAAASDEIAVIGGTDIFTQLLPLADRLEITHVHARPEGDTYFPPIDATQWRAGRAQRSSGRAAGRGWFQLRHLCAELTFEPMGKTSLASTLGACPRRAL